MSNEHSINIQGGFVREEVPPRAPLERRRMLLMCARSWNRLVSLGESCSAAFAGQAAMAHEPGAQPIPRPRSD